MNPAMPRVFSLSPDLRQRALTASRPEEGKGLMVTAMIAGSEARSYSSGAIAIVG